MRESEPLVLPAAPPAVPSLRCAAVAVAPAAAFDGALAILLARAGSPPWAYGLLVGLTAAALVAIARTGRARPGS
ncbi:MAG: hypothetical protein R3C15_20915 [Thermoleophilia bacterium]